MFVLPSFNNRRGRKPPRGEKSFADLKFDNMYGPGRALRGRELERRRKQLEKEHARRTEEQRRHKLAWA